MPSRKRYRVDTTGMPWGIYLRLSKYEAINDRSLTTAQRRKLTVEKLMDHKGEIIAWLNDHGLPWDEDHVYMDAGLSASKPGSKRPDYERIRADARAGKLAGIAITAVDRFTREYDMMKQLVDLAQTTDVQIGGPNSGRLDLLTPDGQNRALELAYQAEREARILSQRLKSRIAVKMRTGKPMGSGRPYGWEVGGQIQRPHEVAIIREVVTRFLAGEKMQALAKELNARGEHNSLGNDWTGSNLTRTVGNHRYGGHVEHNGEFVAKITNPDRSPQQPILDAKTYRALQTKLRSQRTGATPSEKYLLTGVLICDLCGHRMNGATRNRKSHTTAPRVYRCPPTLGGCSQTILAEPVEKKVGEYMVKLFSDKETAAKIEAEAAELGSERAVKSAELDEIEAEMADLVRKRKTLKRISPWLKQELDAAWDDLVQRQAETEAALDDLGAEPITLADVHGDWKAMTTKQKRDLIIRVGVRIGIRRGHGGRTFDTERVMLPPLD